MRRAMLLFTLVALVIVPMASAQDPPALSIAVATDRPDAMYRCGETATFLISAKSGDLPVTAGPFAYTLSLDGGKQIAASQGEFGVEPVKITGTLAQPGVLRCLVSAQRDERPYSALAGAAFDPLEIRPGVQEPADFVTWWDQQKALLRAIPPDAQLTRNDEASNARATYYKISLANVDGKRVYGWLGVPNREGRVPAVLQVPSAGVYTIPPDWAGLAEQGFLAMGITIHDFDVETPAEKVKELSDGPLSGYAHQGRDSRETSYFRAGFLGCVRALDYLCGRPEWDGRTLLVNGSSQGGGLSIICAGLDPRVTAIASNVPALCDHLGYRLGGPPGWPRFVAGPGTPSETTAPYYDAVNFARHARCETVMCVGLVDTTCPAMSVYAAFNVLSGPKEMVVTPTQGHVVSEEYNVARSRMLARLRPAE